MHVIKMFLLINIWKVWHMYVFNTTKSNLQKSLQKSSVQYNTPVWLNLNINTAGPLRALRSFFNEHSWTNSMKKAEVKGSISCNIAKSFSVKCKEFGANR